SDELAALLGDAEALAQERLRRRRAQANQDDRCDDAELGVEPQSTGVDLHRVRLLVDAPLPPRLPLEVLDDVGHVHEPPVDAGLQARRVEELAGGADERSPDEIFVVPGLLADHHDARRRFTLAEDGLCSPPPERAIFTTRRGVPGFLKAIFSHLTG